MSLWDMLHEDLQTKIIDMKIYMHYCDTMMNKQTNDFLRNYIQNHFKSKGKRLTNLSKAKKEHLLRMFTEYNIPKVPFAIEVKIDSKCKFEVGAYTYTYAYRWDALLTTNYHLKINIHKITQCYVFLDVCSQFMNECDKNKLWIDKGKESESISFGDFNVRFNVRAANLVLIT